MRDSQRRYLLSGMDLSLPHPSVLVAQESAHTDKKEFYEEFFNLELPA